VFSAADVFAAMDEHFDESKGAGSARERARFAEGKMRVIKAMCRADGASSSCAPPWTSPRLPGSRLPSATEAVAPPLSSSSGASASSSSSVPARGPVAAAGGAGYLAGNESATCEAVVRLVSAAEVRGWHKLAAVEALPWILSLLQTLPPAVLRYAKRYIADRRAL
jgi:hypothetical protein